MRLRHYQAVHYERVLTTGRTRPVVLGCREDENLPAIPKVVKMIGCPEVWSQRQLVAEVMGNAIARRMGVPTAEPCIVHLSEVMARGVRASLQSEGLTQDIRPGPAAGCELLQMAPIIVGGSMSEDQRSQAARLYVFDMLSQNPDRRRDNPNCAVLERMLVAYDFEICFSHIFLPIIGSAPAACWEPSKSIRGANHVFHDTVKTFPPTEETVEASVSTLNGEWLNELVDSLPEPWRANAQRIADMVRGVAEHASEFARDIMRSLL